MDFRRIRSFFGASSAITLLTVASLSATAQTFPSGPVKVVVPYAAGAGLDMMCRVVSDKVSQFLGKPVVVENRAGAAGTIGAAAVANGPSDGHTMLCANNSEITLAQYVIANMPFNPERDLEPLVMAVRQTVVVAANPTALPTADMREVLTMSKQKPLAYGHSGTGNNLYLAMAMFAAEAGVPFNPIAYRGAAPAIADTLAGHVPITLANLAPLVGHFREGRLKPLMVFQSTRDPALPDVPTVHEVIGRDVRANSWFGFLVKSGTSADVKRRLEDAIRHSLADPTVKEKLQAAQMTIAADVTTEQFARIIAEERAYHAAAVKRFNIQPE